MTEADIQDPLGAVERALKHATDAERCAKHGLKEDQSGSAHQAWQSASMVVRELDGLEAKLRRCLAIDRCHRT
ncbi:hypothetical protein [Methylobacterium sp. P1-11]|uniref:hypothetical protein n=1 Tax=Methylobacterium sp. P1-11 TaxID=2024616 RepID=UPI001567BDAB|nr:hypothetical protein [Methylobacterium sp. P1-11]